MAYSLSNKCAKKIFKRTVLVQLIIKNVVTYFFGNTVYNIKRSTVNVYTKLPVSNFRFASRGNVLGEEGNCPGMSRGLPYPLFAITN